MLPLLPFLLLPLLLLLLLSLLLFVLLPLSPILAVRPRLTLRISLNAPLGLSLKSDFVPSLGMDCRIQVTLTNGNRASGRAISSTTISPHARHRPRPRKSGGGQTRCTLPVIPGGRDKLHM